MTHTKGFTIIELIVVVAIIAILMGIVTSNFSDAKKKSRDAKRISDIAQLQLALELYFDRCNQYPKLGADYLMSLTANNGCPPNIAIATFLSKIPVPPTAGNYTYAVNNNTTPTDYVLRATLETKNQAVLDDVDTTVAYTYATSAAVPGSNVTTGVTCTDDSAPYYYCVQPR